MSVYLLFPIYSHTAETSTENYLNMLRNDHEVTAEELNANHSSHVSQFTNFVGFHP